MLARRVIVVAPEKGFAKELAVALKAAGGVVDIHRSFAECGELQASLIVVHLVGELASEAAQVIGKLDGNTRVIAILPRANLAAVVDIMQQSERVSGMLVAEELDSGRLAAMATRVLVGDIFGLEKLVRWGTQVHSCLVGDYQEKSLCIAQVSEFAESMGVRRKYREALEQCLDEMLMNALYDAPVDEEGRQIFAEIPTKTRISLKLEQKAIVQFACDGKQFALGVRDAFGALERSTVLRYLHKCLHSEHQIDRKQGGAGLGLYLMTSSSTEVYFNVLPGVATEAICAFALDAPKLQLQSFGFFTEKIDATGRLAAGPSRRLPSGTTHPVERRAPVPTAQPRGLIALLVGMIVVTLGLVGVAAWPRLFGGGAKQTTIAIKSDPPGATIEVDGKPSGTATDMLVVDGLEIGRAYPVVARLDGHEPRHAVVQPRAGDNAITLQLVPLAATVVLDSTPSGATVTIAGRPAGTTPLVLSNLAPRSAVEVVFQKPGYQDATARIDVPRPGKETKLVQPLAVAPNLARVKLTSEPPGAQVLQNGQVLAGVTTPADVLVEAGKPVRFVLALPRKVPAVIEPFTPGAGEEGIVKTGALVDGASLRVTSNVDGKLTVVNAPHCQQLALPADCVLAPGTYKLELTGPGRFTRTVKLADTELVQRFEIGFVEAAPGKQLQVGGIGVPRAAFEVGLRKVTISDETGKRVVTVTVKPGAIVIAN